MNPQVTIQPKKHSLPVFFLLAFAISWAFWVPVALASRGILPAVIDPALANLIGAFGPFFAAVITSLLFDGRSGLSRLFRRLLVWRVGFVWSLFVLLWPAVVSVAKTGLHVIFGGTMPDFSTPPFLQAYPLPSEMAGVSPLAFLPIIFLQQSLLGSSMGEEPGWRGYALPRLQAGLTPFVASVILGALWAVWHLPLSLTVGSSAEGTFTIWMVLNLIATSYLFAWIFNHTSGSLLPAIFFHTAIALSNLFIATPADVPAWIEPALNWLLALVIMAASRRREQRSYAAP